MQMRKASALLFGLALLAGCATPVGPLVPPPVPADPEQAATVTVRRDAAAADGVRMVFTINGAPTYQLFPGDRYDFALGAGSYEFGYRMAMSTCSSPVQIDAGGHYVFKLAPDCAIILESQ